MFWVSFYDAQLCSLDSYLLFVSFLSVTIHHHGKLAVHKSCIDLDWTQHCVWTQVFRQGSWLSVSVSAGVGGPELTEPEPERDLSQSLSDSWPLAHRALTGLGLSLVTWPHLRPLIGQCWPHRFCCLLVTLWSALGPASPRLWVCLETRRGESEDWGLWHILSEEYTLIMRPRDLAGASRHSGVRGGWQHNLWLRCPLRLLLPETLDTWS